VGISHYVCMLSFSFDAGTTLFYSPRRIWRSLVTFSESCKGQNIINLLYKPESGDDT